MRLLPLVLLVAATPAAAVTDPAQLDMAVAAFAGQLPGHPGGARAPVDRRLKLADCGGDPKLSWRTPRHDAVVVTCAGPVPWHIFVPTVPGGPGAAAPATAAVEPAALPAAPVRRAEPVIRRGDAVTIGIDQGGFTVSQSGTAMTDAAPGERVRIQIDGARQPVQAVAVSAGQATVPAA